MSVHMHYQIFTLETSQGSEGYYYRMHRFRQWRHRGTWEPAGACAALKRRSRLLSATGIPEARQLSPNIIPRHTYTPIYSCLP